MRILLMVLVASCGNKSASPSASDEPAQTAEADPASAASSGSDSPGGGGSVAPTGADNTAAASPADEQAPPSAASWNSIVSTYVTDDGGFRYAALRDHEEHRKLLSDYVSAVGGAKDEGWSRDAALAFYINAYNALTVHAVLEAWPVKSVMKVKGFFDKKKHTVVGEEMTLNDLENKIIRSKERFAEPRIHFGVNCASVGCPPLQNEAFTAENLEAKLAAATQAFVRKTSEVKGRKVKLSKIFEWFKDDFEAAGGVRAFVAQYLEGPAAEKVRDESSRLKFVDYDWNLNGRK